jgi:ribose/xylose/arabinose/galactoside ABC-type transport system permease subunit
MGTGRRPVFRPLTARWALFDAYVGGTRLGGGRGNVTGTVLGVLIVSILRAGLNMTGLPAPWQMVILGALITGTLVADAMMRNRERRYAA